MSLPSKITNESQRPILFLPEGGGMIIGVLAEASLNALQEPCQVILKANNLLGYTKKGCFFRFRIDDPTICGMVKNLMERTSPDISIWVLGDQPKETGFAKIKKFSILS